SSIPEPARTRFGTGHAGVRAGVHRVSEDAREEARCRPTSRTTDRGVGERRDGHRHHLRARAVGRRQIRTVERAREEARLRILRNRPAPITQPTASTSTSCDASGTSSGSTAGHAHFIRRPYDKWIAYGQSKTANALFALALDARGAASGVRAFSVHPGAIIETGLSSSLSPDEMQAAVEAARKVPAGFKSVGEGAATSVWCATSPQLEDRGGVYCEDCDIAIAVPADHPEPRGARPWACDSEVAERLWRA